MWTFAFASRAGAVHADGACQDRLAIRTAGRALVLCASDGAGSARFGAEGAEAACAGFLDAVVAGKRRVRLRTSQSGAILDHVRLRIGEAALDRGARMADLACTLVGVVLEPRSTFVFQVGDGVTVLGHRGSLSIPLWPEGEVVNESAFVTDANAHESARAVEIAGPAEAAFLLTDGLQYLVLDVRERKPHAPFFDAVSRQFDRATAPLVPARGGQDGATTLVEGECRAVSHWLDAMLASPLVTSKTDDDTAIIVARRVR